jgi:hypothetical protein
MDRSNSLGCGEEARAGVEAGLGTRVGKVSAGSVGISSAGNAGDIGILSATGSLRGSGGRQLLTTTAIGSGAMPRMAKQLNAAK